jgi:hypothetical protein
MAVGVVACVNVKEQKVTRHTPIVSGDLSMKMTPQHNQSYSKPSLVHSLVENSSGRLLICCIRFCTNDFRSTR